MGDEDTQADTRNNMLSLQDSHGLRWASDVCVLCVLTPSLRLMLTLQLCVMQGPIPYTLSLQLCVMQGPAGGADRHCQRDEGQGGLPH